VGLSFVNSYQPIPPDTSPPADFFDIDELYIMCTKPIACISFKPDRPRPTGFQDLEPSVIPVFPLEQSIPLKGYSVRRKQVPKCRLSAFDFFVPPLPFHRFRATACDSAHHQFWRNGPWIHAIRIRPSVFRVRVQKQSPRIKYGSQFRI
jgi:hypothetical protein